MDYKIQKINFVEFAKNAKIKCNKLRLRYVFSLQVAGKQRLIKKN